MTKAKPVSPLAALILNVIAQEEQQGNVLTYADIARRGGGDLTRNNVQRYATRKPDRLVELEKRRALAMGLRVHPVVVDRAIADSLDLWLDLETADYRVDPTLTAADRDKIDAYIQAIKDSKGRRSRNG